MTKPLSFRALFVGDDPHRSSLVEEILTSRGHSVTRREDEGSAWDAYIQIEPSLLIVDRVLPELNGLELLRSVRDQDGEAACTILVLTEEETPEALAELLAAGADDYVVKPMDRGLFEIRLSIAERRAIRKAKGWSSGDTLKSGFEEFGALSKHLNQVFFSVDLRRKRVTSVSPGIRKLLGVEQADLLEMEDAWTNLLCPKELKEGERYLRDASPLEPQEFEHELVRPDGETLWVRTTLKPVFTENEDVVQLYGFIADLTARKVVEEELSARNLELLTLNQILEITLASPDLKGGLPEALDWIVDATGFPLAYVGRLDPRRGCLVLVGEKGMGFPSDGSVAIPLNESLGALALERQQPLALADARSHPRFQSDFLYKQEIRSLVAFPLETSEATLGVLALADTAVRSIPLRLLRWGESLANALASFMERVESDAALRESERAARKLAHDLRLANEELEAFAYSVSHDLRAPLRTMQGFAHALVQEHGNAIPPQARDFVQRIIDSGRISESLIRDLLAYSRMSFEDLELQEVELEQALAEAREQVQAYVLERKATVTTPGTLPAVMAHHTTMVQVLANIISNAVKFVPEGRTPEVAISWDDAGEEGAIRLSVSDNGMGIPEDQREKIFKVFERLDGGVSGESTGIGLAIVRRAMDRIGGRVWVDSKEGEGSTFWVEMPTAKAQGWHPWRGRKNRRD